MMVDALETDILRPAKPWKEMLAKRRSELNNPNPSPDPTPPNANANKKQTKQSRKGVEGGGGEDDKCVLL